MTRWDRRLFSAITAAHRFTRREKSVCRRLARLYGLDGKRGIQSSPAMIFFRPSYWEVFLRDARQEGDPRLPPEEILSLAEKLFAGTDTA